MSVWPLLDEEMCLNEIGRIVQDEWLRTAEIRRNILIDEFIIMPNHLHGILYLREWNDVGAHCNVPLPQSSQPKDTENPLLIPSRRLSNYLNQQRPNKSTKCAPHQGNQSGNVTISSGLFAMKLNSAESGNILYIIH